MMVRRLFLITLSAAIALLAADPTIGTWRLNVAKSKYRPGPAPRSETRVYTLTKNGIKGTVNTVWSDGKSTKVEFPANTDGKDYPVTGSQGADAVSWNRIDENSASLILKHAGRTIGSGRRVVSADGKTMTITYQGVNSLGDQVDNIVVYDRR
jgi:hypothetical protein